MPCRALALALALAPCLGACRAAPLPVESEIAGLPRGPTLTLPPDWRRLEPEAFETWVLAALPEERATPLDRAALLELGRALDEVETPLEGGRIDPVGVRAAVILGRSRFPSSASILIRRLEKRVLGPARHSDCGDALGAAALARFPDPRRYAQRLVPLAVGSRPHPDLEVRVECAASALFAGYREVVPFLLEVLRIDTPAGQADARDFAVSPTTAWARQRAAEALSQAAGVPVAYRFDAPMAARAAEAARLEGLLAPAEPATSR